VKASHPQVPHPGRQQRGTGATGAARWNDKAVDWLTDHVLASAVMFDTAFILPLLVLPLSTSVKVTLGVVSGSWIQWWALPALQRSANRADRARDAKADADHQALTHIAVAVDAIRAAVEAGKDGTP
jgi:hypothetical protein